MRVNVYAEEMSDRVEIVEKEIDGEIYTGLRFYLYLPVTGKDQFGNTSQVSGPFHHRQGDDDSAAITFWGKKSLSALLVLALAKLEEHHGRARRGN